MCNFQKKWWRVQTFNHLQYPKQRSRIKDKFKVTHTLFVAIDCPWLMLPLLQCDSRVLMRDIFSLWCMFNVTIRRIVDSVHCVYCPLSRHSIPLCFCKWIERSPSMATAAAAPAAHIETLLFGFSIYSIPRQSIIIYIIDRVTKVTIWFLLTDCDCWWWITTETH